MKYARNAVPVYEKALEAYLAAEAAAELADLFEPERKMWRQTQVRQALTNLRVRHTLMERTAAWRAKVGAAA